MEYLCCGSKKRKKVHRATGPIFKNQLTRTKVFFIPGLSVRLYFIYFSHVDIGHTGMSIDDVTDNVVAACTRLSHTLPGTAANIRTMYLTPEKNPISLPIYASFGNYIHMYNIISLTEAFYFLLIGLQTFSLKILVRRTK